jgi:competence protein ComEA
VPDVPSSPIEPFRPLPDPTWRERVESLVESVRSGGLAARVAVGAVAVSAVVIAAFFLLRPSAPSVPVEVVLPRASAGSDASAAPPAPSSALVIVVHAAGAVVHPGVYRLPPDARVDDLVRAAGGLASDADGDQVNLAAVLSDGQRVYVPRVGESVPPDASGANATSSSDVIDLNSATVAQLDTLPGVGPATAQAIVDYREKHGRFRSVDELLDVRGIGPAKLDEIRPFVKV